MATVTSNVSRINDLEGSPTLIIVGGSGTANANTDIFLQGTQSAGRRRSNVTLHGFLVDDGAGGNDISAPGTHVGAWVWVTHFKSLTDLRLRIADDSGVGNYHDHQLPLSEYPKLGGWVRIWVDVSRTPIAVGGTGLNTTTARYFGPIVSLPAVGGSTPNIILDAVDHTTTGLTLTGTDGVWQDFLAADEDDPTNKYGVVTSSSGIIFCQARLTLGSSSSLAFSDSGFSIIFPQQTLVSDTFMGVSCDLQHASTSITWNAGSLSSPGTKRGDLIITGSSGTFSATACTFNRLRLVNLNSRCTINNCTFSACGTVTASGATISNSTFSNTAAASGALDIASPSEMALVTNCEFKNNTTFGIRLTSTTAQNYNFTGIQFSGNNKDIYVAAPTGTVQINILGGNSPTYTSAGAVVDIVNAVVVKVTVKDAVTGAAIQDARVYIAAAAGGDLAEGTVILNALSDSSGVVQDSAFSFTNNQPVMGRVRKGSTPPLYKTSPISGIITSNGLDLTVFMVEDE